MDYFPPVQNSSDQFSVQSVVCSGEYPLLGVEVCNAAVKGNIGHAEAAGDEGCWLSLFDKMQEFSHCACLSIMLRSVEEF